MGRALSDDELATLRSELAAGNTPTVWFTADAVGVTEGRSGKVMDLSEPAEGDFIQVRPAGSKDVLSFSTGEVTTERPPRKRSSSASGDSGRSGSGGKSASPGNSAPAGGSRGSGSRGSGASGTSGSSGGTSSASSGATASARRAASGSGAERSSGGAATRSAQGSFGSASSGSGASSSGQQAGAQSKTSTATSGGQERGGSGGARSGQRRQRSTPGAVVTLTADAEGQWHVEVTSGKKRVLRSTPVPPSAVAQAAHALHDDVAAAVEPVLEAARERQRSRVEQLQQELDNARRLLEDLDGQQG